MKAELGLDKSIVMQYVDWMKNFVTGDWGYTFQTNQSIKTEVVRALPISLYIMIYAQILSLMFAVPVAIWSAYRQGRQVRPGRNHHRVRAVVGAQLHRRARVDGVVLRAAEVDPVPVDLRRASMIRSPTSRRSSCRSSPLPYRSMRATCGCCAPT